jgi:hypothetical protein
MEMYFIAHKGRHSHVYCLILSAFLFGTAGFQNGFCAIYGTRICGFVCL